VPSDANNEFPTATLEELEEKYAAGYVQVMRSFDFEARNDFTRSMTAARKGQDIFGEILVLDSDWMKEIVAARNRDCTEQVKSMAKKLTFVGPRQIVLGPEFTFDSINLGYISRRVMSAQSHEQHQDYVSARRITIETVILLHVLQRHFPGTRHYDPYLTECQAQLARFTIEEKQAPAPN
jgi:hypothetical protein